MITHVAIKRNGKVYSLPPPNRHHDVLYSMPEEEQGVSDEVEARDVQGFLDDKGNFLTRSEAYQMVVNTPQFIRKEKNKEREHYYDGPNLYSEDLW
jgi:hypothetical protein